MLLLENVNKTISDSEINFEVLKDISFSVKKGEFVCLLGPSGCGKTVLLCLIAGFFKPTRGNILFEDKPITGPNLTRIMMFQNYVLFPWKTVLKNVAFGLDKISLSKEEKERLSLDYLDLVGLSKFKDWYIHKLSGGMQQRVALARSLIVNPKLLLMDEPFSALDIEYRRKLRRNIEEIWEKTRKTIIFVTHNIEEAVHLADTVYLLSNSPAYIINRYEIRLPRPRRSVGKEGTDFYEIVSKIKEDMRGGFHESIDSELLDNLKLEQILNYEKKTII